MPQIRANSNRPPRPHDALSLGVAFIGFSESVKARLFGWIEPLCGEGSWREVAPDLADAICIHEDAIASFADSSLIARPEFAAGTPIRLDKPLRPVGVASRSPQAMPGCVMFDAESQYSAVNLFRTFEARLALIRNEYAMGAALAAKRGNADSGGVFHLMHCGRLAAIADLSGKTFGARPPVHIDVLLCAEWHKRPDSAAEMPEGFIARSLTDLLWTYTSRSNLNALPIELRSSSISLRQLPQVPMDRLNALHVKVMASIQRGQKTLEELYDEIGGLRVAVDRSIGALYYAGVLSLSRPSSLQKLASRLLAPAFRTRSHGLESVRQFFLRESSASLLLSAT